MTKDGTYASPPCMAAGVCPSYFDPLGVDPEQARDVARWRRAERTRLAGRAQVSGMIAGHLGRVLGDRGVRRGCVLSGYWPIKGEPDLRPALADLHRAGVTIALPVVETRAAPLVFRRWTPETKLVRGDWNIPVPLPEADELMPEVMLAPCLGWDGACFRLGWAGVGDTSTGRLRPFPCVRLPSVSRLRQRACRQSTRNPMTSPLI